MSFLPTFAWQRHQAIDVALASYFRLELEYPSVAALVHGGDVKSENEDQREAWRIFIRATAALLSQIYHASRDITDNSIRSASNGNLVESHGDHAISTIVSRTSKSFMLFSDHVFWHPYLRNHVDELVETFLKSEAEIQEMLSRRPEETNA